MNDCQSKRPYQSHDMIRLHGAWRCVNCGRVGTIEEVNVRPCPFVGTTASGKRDVIDAIKGEGKFKVPVKPHSGG